VVGLEGAVGPQNFAQDFVVFGTLGVGETFGGVEVGGALALVIDIE
jgi:hypothetical protein